MAMNPVMSAAPDDSADQPDDMSAGYVIEITVKTGSGAPAISVSVEPLQEEGAEESAAGAQDDAQGGGDESGDSEDGQSVANAGEAAQLVRDIIKNSGQIGGNPDRQAMASEVWGKNGQ